MGQVIGSHLDFKQWGYVNGNKIATVTFPLAHTTAVYSVLATRRYGQNYIHVNDITLTQFTGDFAYGGDYKQAMWLSVGEQLQWGLYEQPGVSNYTVTFPITFSSQCWACVNTCGMESSKGAQAYGVYSRSTTNFVSAGYGTSVATTTYMAIGLQQWGTATRGATNNFPIAFTTLYNLNVGLGAGENNNYGENPYAVTAAGFNLGDRGTYYTAIGVQQWGVVSSLTTITYPIALSTIYIVMQTWQNAASNASYPVNTWDITTTDCRFSSKSKCESNETVRWIAIGS